MIRSAVLSPCGRYRYRLERVWDQDQPRAAFVMLNPSVADAEQDDPTIRKCSGFAERWDCGGILVVNLFALRATDPRDLLDALRRGKDAVGPDNDVAGLLGRLCPAPALVVLAWGGHAEHILTRPRAGAVIHALADLFHLFCLGRTAGGSPRHPLMLAYSTPIEPWGSR